MSGLSLVMVHQHDLCQVAHRTHAEGSGLPAELQCWNSKCRSIAICCLLIYPNLECSLCAKPSLGAETMDMTKALYRVIEFTL